MKHNYSIRMIWTMLFAVILTTTGCEKEKDDPQIPVTETLLVKFFNDSRSVVTITHISIKHMGAVQTPKRAEITTVDEWSANLLTNGNRLAPGDFQLFTIDIPSGHYANYRLGIDKGDGTEIMLFDQPGVQDEYPPITHWGGHDRTVSVTIYKNESSDTYYIAGWSDFTGITP